MYYFFSKFDNFESIPVYGTTKHNVKILELFVHSFFSFLLFLCFDFFQIDI